MTMPADTRVCLSRAAFVWAGIVSCLSLVACQPDPRLSGQPSSAQTSSTPVPTQGPASPEGPPAFLAWLKANPDQAPRYEKFKAYLESQGVGEVLPAHAVIQTETESEIGRCGIAPYAVPDESLWPAMIPTLRLVRDHVVPAVGPVQVLSSYRTEEANRCSAGAKNSPHTRFGALDLQIRNDMSQKQLFARLCKLWDDLPAELGFGLGAYYTRSMPGANEEGRFHVDTLGRRTWGFGYGAYTSHCRELGYISVKSPQQIKAEEEAKLKAEEEAKLKLEADEKAKKDLEAKAKLDAAKKLADLQKAEQAAKRKQEKDALDRAAKVVVPKVSAPKVIAPLDPPQVSPGDPDSKAPPRQP
jgi:Peptidase M15